LDLKNNVYLRSQDRVRSGWVCRFNAGMLQYADAAKANVPSEYRPENRV